MGEPTLQLDHISFRYNDDAPYALKDLSVAVDKHEKVAVLGNNGAGKSTFFLCCNKVLTPEEGTVSLNGEVIGKSKKEINRLRQAVGLIFQDPDSQIIASTVESEISFGPMNLRLDESDVKRRIDESIQKMQLEEFRTRPPHYLSGGERKRVSIADILAMEPEVMLFDEPEASLDPYNVALLEKNLKMLHDQGLGIIISTHDVNFAWRWADRILVFNAGEMVKDATPEEVFADMDLLIQCNLEQPILYRIGEMFGLDPYPRYPEDIDVMQVHDSMCPYAGGDGHPTNEQCADHHHEMELVSDALHKHIEARSE